MSIITLIKHRLRAAKIRRMEADIAYEREHADSYLSGRVAQLEQLKREHDQRTSEQVRADVERAAKLIG